MVGVMRFLKLFLLIFFPVYMMQNSCSSEMYAPNLLVTGDSGYNYVQSQKEWNKLKKRHQNSYQYTVLEQSFSGFGSETTITVINGDVVSRKYESFSISEEDGTKEIIDSYVEEKEELGMHDEGWPPVDLDEMYKDCGTDYLMVDPDSHTLYFDTNEDGVMTLCGNVPELCGDDCFNGFSITNFQWLK